MCVTADFPSGSKPAVVGGAAGGAGSGRDSVGLSSSVKLWAAGLAVRGGAGRCLAENSSRRIKNEQKDPSQVNLLRFSVFWFVIPVSAKVSRACKDKFCFPLSSNVQLPALRLPMATSRAGDFLSLCSLLPRQTHVKIAFVPWLIS